jgi:hypothetical protein
MFFNRPKSPIILKTRAVVCSLNARFDGLLAEDGLSYSSFFPSTIISACHNINELRMMIARGCDIVHVFGLVSDAGVITDDNGSSMAGTMLIQACCSGGVKLLCIASDTSREACIKGFSAGNKPLNLVLTLDRRGPLFGSFLAKLLAKLAAGKTLPIAWVEIAPQTVRAPEHNDLPATIFAAGLGGAVFR